MGFGDLGSMGVGLGPNYPQLGSMWILSVAT